MQMTHETPKKKSERTCVGCGRADAPGALLRFVLAGNEVAVDAGASGFGRGAHVHPTADCVAKACKAGFSRSFKTKVEASPAELAKDIEHAYDRRITGLVLGGRRAGKIAIGQDAACEALAQGARLVVIACDAGSVAKKEAVSRAVAEGHAVAWKDKAALGALFGRDEVGIFAVTELGIASEIKEARSRSEACKVREER